jgi:hypothetical protein
LYKIFIFIERHVVLFFRSGRIFVHNCVKKPITIAMLMKLRLLPLPSPFVKLSFCAAAGALLWGAASSARADYPTTVLSLNPLVYYRFNETVQPPPADTATNSGTAGARGNAYYYNDQAIDPTLNATHGQPGALAGSTDTAVTFNGTANYIMMALPDDTNSLNPQGPFSAEVWLNPAGSVSSCPLAFADVYGLGGNADGWLIYQTGTNWNLTMFDGNGSEAAVSISGGTVVEGSWYHLVAVYDGTNANLYVNGQSVAQASAAGFVPNKSGQLTIGTRGDESDFFAGSADEVAIYSNALSAADVLSHYQNGTNASRATPYNVLVQAGNPLLYYRLDEPAYTAPVPTALPVATNLGTLGTNANGIYLAGTTPGAAGPPFSGLGATPLACRFNGASGNVELGDIVSLLGGTIPPNLTVSAWVQLVDLEQNLGFDMIVGTDSESFQLERGMPGDHGTLEWFCNGEHISSYEGVIPIGDGQWHHLVAIVAPTGFTNYVDGVLDFERPEPTLQGSTLGTSTAITLVGENTQYPGRVWDGSISEVAIFATNLSPAQVQELYAASDAFPEITVQPAVTPPVYAGSTVSLSVTAAGEQPLNYQWTLNTFTLSGQTTPNLAFTNVTSAINGSYAVIVSNAYGVVTSSVVPISVVSEAPVVLQPPAPITRWVGGSPSLFTVVAGGSEPYSYQWQFGTNPIPGATSATLTLPGPLQASDAGEYEVVIANPSGSSTSAPVALTVATAPNNYAAQVMALGPYTYWPLNETNGSIAYDYSSGLNGTNVGTIILGAAGNPAPGFGGHPVYNFNTSGGVDCGNVVNMNNTTFTMLAWVFDNNSGAAQGGILSKGGGDPGAGSAAARNGSWRLDIFSAHYLEYSANGIYPFVNENGGGTATFLTGPGGSYTPPVTNILDDGQWHFVAAVYNCPYSDGDKRLYFDGVLVQETNVLGSFCENTDDAWIGNVNDNGNQFWPGMLSDIALFNRALSASEVAALYTVATNGASPSLGIVGQPVSQVAFAGHPATFTVGATGPQPFSYQWSRGGAPIPGANRQSYTIPVVSPGDAGAYTVEVTDSAGSTNSQTAWLSVVPALPPATGLAVGLVAHYQFESNFTDSSGNNHNAMAVGSPQFVPGRIGTAIHVDSTGSSLNDCVVLDNPANIDNNADFQFNTGDMFSIAFWVNWTNTPGDLPMIGNVVESTDNQGLVMADSYFDDNGGNIQFSLQAWPTFLEGDFTADGPALINDGHWHHVVAAVDLLNLVAQAYIDGVLVKTHSLPNVGNLNYSDGYLLGSDPAYNYEGNTAGGYSIDDMGIWRRLLTADEVATIYNAGVLGQSFAPAVSPPGLVVPLSITLTGATVQLDWSQGTLESAPAVTGPWTAVAGASPPSFSTSHTNAATFYRLGQ